MFIRVPLHNPSFILKFLISITNVTTFDINLCTGSPGNLKEFKYSINLNVLHNRYCNTPFLDCLFF